MIDRILVPLDGSPLAECALPHAAAVGRAFGATVLLVRVLGSPGRGGPGMLGSFEWRLRHAEIEQYLRQLAGRLSAAGVQADAATMVGRASDEILKVARERRIDLLVLTTHGQGGVTDFHLSGTAAKVISRASSSILVVAPPAVGCGAGIPQYHRIVVPVDCSKRADWAACVAAVIARSHRAELLLIHAVQQPDVVTEAGNAPAAARLASQLTDLNRGNAQAHLEALTASLAAPDLKVSFRILSNGNVAQTLQRAARDEGADLVVLSAHGRSPGAGWPYGAVAGTLIAHGTVPTLLLQDLPPKETKRWLARPAERIQGASAG